MDQKKKGKGMDDLTGTVSIAKSEGPAIAASELLQAITAAVSNPALDVGKMQALLAMHKELLADQRETAFKAALAELQKELPQIERDGRIVVDNRERNRYARFETIDIVIRPLLAKHGFAISYNEEDTRDDKRKYSATLDHAMGHSRTKYKELPLDRSGSKNAVQSEGSTTSYARRYLLMMHLNLVTRDVDNDANDVETITAEEI